MTIKKEAGWGSGGFKRIIIIIIIMMELKKWRLPFFLVCYFVVHSCSPPLSSFFLVLFVCFFHSFRFLILLQAFARIGYARNNKSLLFFGALEVMARWRSFVPVAP